MGGRSPWDGARALVTGASSGIGEAIARRLAAAGAAVVVTGRNAEALEALAAAHPGSVEAVAGDLTRPEVRERLAAAAGDRLDLLVNNAGVTMNARFEELDPEVVRRIMEINFFATVELTRLLLPALVTARGRIVVMSSVTGLVGTPTRSAYAASKHALHGLFGSLRVELRRRGVSVTIVCPGYVATPMRRRALLADGSEQGRDQAEGRRMLSADAVARATLAAAARRRRLVRLGSETHAARLLSLVAPGLLDAILERATR